MKIKDNIGKFLMYTHTDKHGKNFFTDFYIDLSKYTILYFFIPVSEEKDDKTDDLIKMDELIKICFLDSNNEESLFTLKCDKSVEELLNDFVYQK